MTETILQAIENSGMTRYRISQLSGVGAPTLSRFVHGKALSLENADKLCKVLGLQLTNVEEHL